MDLARARSGRFTDDRYFQTLTATERTLCCIFENYQTEDGLVVPEVLRKYIPGQPEFLPYVKDLPKDKETTVVTGLKKK